MICKKCMKKKADPKIGICSDCFADQDQDKEISFEDDEDEDIGFEEDGE